MAPLLAVLQVSSDAGRIAAVIMAVEITPVAAVVHQKAAHAAVLWAVNAAGKIKHITEFVRRIYSPLFSVFYLNKR
ncbi:hypothetical protein RBA64_04800 [Brenneria goodwinii]